MVSCAFAAAPALLSGDSGIRSRPLTAHAPSNVPVVRPAHTRMVMNGDDRSASSKPLTDAASSVSPSFSAPSFETTVFSDFVDSAQERIDTLQEKINNVDTDALVEDVKLTGTGLVDNVIAGDWLDRGELYGAIQLLFVALLLRSPGFLDNIIGFALGPLVLIAGSALSAKAVFDLGRKQLSIWPAPVPGGELKTNGLYQYVRHPVYAGLLLASAGFAAATASPERLALTLALGLFLSKKVAVEEQFLEDTYSGYSRYKEEVPFRLIPRVW